MAAFKEEFVGFGMITIVALGLVFLWVLGGFFSMQASRKAREKNPPLPPRPEFRLADQWLKESQTKLEALIEKMESPLGTAQHELLDLRLEAGRLPQGVKSIRDVRENLATGIRPIPFHGSLRERAAQFLLWENYDVLSEDCLTLKTPMGPLSCRQALRETELVTEETMKGVMKLVLEVPVEGISNGFVYFAGEPQAREFQSHPEWAEAFKKQGVIALDPKGLTALLVALKMHQDAQKLIQVFEAGVQTTQALVGQADQMAAALGKMNADSLRSRMVMEGGIPRSLDPEAGEPTVEREG
jgi:uncharacterized protein YneF (UPF0154 family)